MFSILSYFSNDDQFIQLLEESAIQTNAMAVALKSLIQSPNSIESVKEFSKAEYSDLQLTEKIRELLVSTFIMALEREDVEALSTALLKIAKTINKFGERFKAGQHLADKKYFIKQLDHLTESTVVLIELIGCLKKITDLKNAKALKDRLAQCEYQADKLLDQAIEKLYQTETDAVRLFVTKDLLSHLESAIDRCRNTGDIVYQIILKNS